MICLRSNKLLVKMPKKKLALAEKFAFQPKEKLSHTTTAAESKTSEEVDSKITLEQLVEENEKTLPHQNLEEMEKKSKSKATAVKIKYEDDNLDSGKDIYVNKKSKWAPKNWETILNNIREMRKGMDAPVDTMGCHTSHDESSEQRVQRYQILISLMLSSQTKDQITHAAVLRLREHGLTIENILLTDDDTLQKLIYPVGFYKRKVTYIKKVTEILKRDYNGDIPNTVKELCKLPGVGPKMAHLAMNIGWGALSGIGVDTHVHRITNRLHWVPRETKTPEATRKALEDWLPQANWFEVNHLMVGFGQTICKPIKPLCGQCLNKKICPSAEISKK